VQALGGWDYIKETSDLSFNSTMNLVVYLHVNYAAAGPDFAKAVGAAMRVYPRLGGAYEPAIKRAYGRNAVVKAQDAARNGTLPKLPNLPSLPGASGNESAPSLAGVDEQAVQAGFLQTAWKRIHCNLRREWEARPPNWRLCQQNSHPTCPRSSSIRRRSFPTS